MASFPKVLLPSLTDWKFGETLKTNDLVFEKPKPNVFLRTIEIFGIYIFKRPDPDLTSKAIQAYRQKIYYLSKS